MIVIKNTPIYYGQSILFTIDSVAYSCNYSSFEWYLNDVMIGTESSYILLLPKTGDKVYVKVKDYSKTTPYWHDGHFYGGTFNGNFNDGTFHYGKLNDCLRTKPDDKPKPFIKNK